MVRVGVWLYPWAFIRVGKMSIATGLTRLDAVFKGIGYVCFAFAAIAAFVSFQDSSRSDGAIFPLLFFWNFWRRFLVGQMGHSRIFQSNLI